MKENVCKTCGSSSLLIDRRVCRPCYQKDWQKNISVKSCKVCNQPRKTPYKEMCRKCYQNEWARTIPEKICEKCAKSFKTVGAICRTCYSSERNAKTRSIPCRGCQRVGLLILNRAENLCTKCDRLKKEAADPMLAQKRRDQTRKSNRKMRGTDPNAPIRKSKGWWLSSQGYVMLFRPEHPNRDANGCIKQHTLVMSEKLGRPLTEDENVHHINGIRDDNRIENLELWSKSQPCGQRVEDKIKWAKEILTKYADLC
jgi:hypothetical protein